MNAPTEQLLAVIASGLIGALGAIGAQLLSATRDRQVREADIKLRQTELWSSAAMPVAARRVEAFEQVYDLLQRALDAGAIGHSDYEALRRLVIYLPDSLRPDVLQALTDLSAGRGDQARTNAASDRLRNAQRDIRRLVGLNAIDSYIENLSRGAE